MKPLLALLLLLLLSTLVSAAGGWRSSSRKKSLPAKEEIDEWELIDDHDVHYNGHGTSDSSKPEPQESSQKVRASTSAPLGKEAVTYVADPIVLDETIIKDDFINEDDAVHVTTEPVVTGRLTKEFGSVQVTTKPSVAYEPATDPMVTPVRNNSNKRKFSTRDPINSTPTDSTNAEKAMEEELAYLDLFRNYNAHVHMEQALVPILTEKLPNVSKNVVQQIVEDASESKRVSLYYPYHEDPIVSSLQRILGLYTKDRLNKVVELSKEMAQENLEREIESRDKLIELVESSKETAQANLKREIESKGLPAALLHHEDDWRMDVLVASIIVQGEQANPDAFEKAVKKNTRKYQHSMPDDMDEKLTITPASVKTLNVREIVHEARQTARRETDVDVDTQLSDALAAFSQKLNRDPFEIQKAVTLARNMLTLEVAIQERKLFALRKFVKRKVDYPLEYFKRILRKIQDEKDTEMYNILCPHVSFLNWIAMPTPATSKKPVQHPAIDNRINEGPLSVPRKPLQIPVFDNRNEGLLDIVYTISNSANHYPQTAQLRQRRQR